MQIVPDDNGKHKYSCEREVGGYLVAVGGGKDSVVSLELLRKYHDETLCYIIKIREALR